MTEGLKRDNVFINCPFDDGYRPIFDALVFAIFDLGLTARCAREVADSGEVRIKKIERIIAECKFGIHDVPEVRLDAENNLPRFNMPLELGLFLGCKRFGGPKQRAKDCLILDAEPYRYQKFISDIAGQDIRAHKGDPNLTIKAVRDWLATASTGNRRSPGGAAIVKHYLRFVSDLPQLCESAELEADALTFSDLSELIDGWLITSR